MRFRMTAYVRQITNREKCCPLSAGVVLGLKHLRRRGIMSMEPERSG